MIFLPTDIDGVLIVEPELIEDERGFFARTWCREEFAARGLAGPFDQSSVSFNRRKGTLRGLHYQVAPHQEAKLVRCTAGCLFDVIADLRPGSPSRLSWIGVELSARNHRMVYIPKGCAHGFQTLEDDTEIFYEMAGSYHATSSRGVRWDDPTLAVDWPLDQPFMSDRDRALPALELAPC